MRKRRCSFAAVVSALIALSLGGNACADPAPANPDCTLTRFLSLPLRTQLDGRVSIPMAVRDRPMQFLVDTGAMFSVIGASAANSVGLTQSPLPGGLYFEFPYGRTMLTKFVRPDTVNLGGVPIKNWEFVVTPDFRLEGETEGFLGANILKYFDVELDFAHSELNVFSPDHCPGRVVYWTKAPYAQVPMTLNRTWQITIPVTIDGHELTATVDTGAAISAMPYDKAQDIFGWKDDDPRLMAIGSSANRDARHRKYRFPFVTMNFEGVSIANPDIVLEPSTTVARDAPLLLGANVLRQLRVYIAYSEKNLYLTPAEAQ